ncbi:hypothetical protein M3Y99_00962500 [Aphelenchoides fujianensis]|nr:hypothetical protein M3Y99_00962500 [Aphelenchoides fujianensis]
MSLRRAAGGPVYKEGHAQINAPARARVVVVEGGRERDDSRSFRTLLHRAARHPISRISAVRICCHFFRSVLPTAQSRRQTGGRRRNFGGRAARSPSQHSRPTRKDYFDLRVCKRPSEHRRGPLFEPAGRREHCRQRGKHGSSPRVGGWPRTSRPSAHRSLPEARDRQFERAAANAFDEGRHPGTHGLCALKLLKAGADPYKRDQSRQFTAFEWADFVGRRETASLIADKMLDHKSADHSGKQLQSKLSNASNNLKQLARLAAVPIISGDQLPALPRPRVRSAPPVPSVKIHSAPKEKPLLPTHQRVTRPSSSMA